MEVPSIPVRLSENQLESGVKEVMTVVRPQWVADETWTKLTSKIFTDGITNKLIGYFLAEEPRDVIIFKIYGLGTEDIIDRRAEIETMKFLNARGMGPKIYGVFDNGIAYEFIPGKTLDPVSCRDPRIYPLVAAEMARLHSIPIKEAPSQDISAFWNKMNTFLNLANQILETDPVMAQNYADFGQTPTVTSQSVAELKRRCDSAGMPLSFCHNDILLPNIVFDEPHSKVSFIDYEYAFINYGPFDIANHFNEFAGVENADFSLCPDDTFMSAWIAEYLKHWKNPEKLEGVNVARVLNWVKLCIPLSHLFWTIWTVVQARNSTIDFSYVAYGKKRFNAFEQGMKSLPENH